MAQHVITDYLNGSVSLEDAAAQLREALQSSATNQENLDKLTALEKAIPTQTTWPCVITMIICS